jgi:hypothetical protein
MADNSKAHLAEETRPFTCATTRARSTRYASPPPYSDFYEYADELARQRYASYIDPYHGIPRLDLFQFNGAPLPPMYLVYNPPQMVPTKQLHPPEDANTTTRRMKRSLELKLLPKAISVDEQSVWLDRDTWWWVGLGMTGVGSLLYYCF